MDRVNRPGGRADNVAEVAETVVIGVGGDHRINQKPVPADQMGHARRMNAHL